MATFEQNLKSDKEYLQNVKMHKTLEEFVIAALRSKPDNIFAFMKTWADEKDPHRKEAESKPSAVKADNKLTPVEKSRELHPEHTKDTHVHAEKPKDDHKPKEAEKKPEEKHDDKPKESEKVDPKPDDEVKATAKNPENAPTGAEEDEL